MSTAGQGHFPFKPLQQGRQLPMVPEILVPVSEVPRAASILSYAEIFR